MDRFQTAKALGFAKPTDNSMDSVSDRDYAIELLSDLSLLMMHLSRFSEEIILWCSWEFKFVDLDDAYSTGSSIMPQKKNPDVAELVRGKTGRVYGSLITLLTMMKGLPLAYNKDMQEDKEALFDAIDTVEQCLPVFAAMGNTLSVRRHNMERAAAGGFINATDCADYLVKKGMPFREAYMIVGRLVNLCIKNHETLDTLTLRDFRPSPSCSDEGGVRGHGSEELRQWRKVYGGPARGVGAEADFPHRGVCGGAEEIIFSKGIPPPRRVTFWTPKKSPKGARGQAQMSASRSYSPVPWDPHLRGPQLGRLVCRRKARVAQSIVFCSITAAAEFSITFGLYFCRWGARLLSGWGSSAAQENGGRGKPLPYKLL